MSEINVSFRIEADDKTFIRLVKLIRDHDSELWEAIKPDIEAEIEKMALKINQNKGDSK